MKSKEFKVFMDKVKPVLSSISKYSTLNGTKVVDNYAQFTNGDLRAKIKFGEYNGELHTFINSDTLAKLAKSKFNDIEFRPEAIVVDNISLSTVDCTIDGTLDKSSFSDFEAFELTTKKLLLTMPVEDLLKVIKATSHAVSDLKDNILGTYHFDLADNSIVVTTGSVLVRYDYSFSDVDSSVKQFNLPYSQLKLFAKALKHYTGSLEFYQDITPNLVEHTKQLLESLTVKAGDDVWIFKLNQGQYPRYKQLIPTSSREKITFNRKQLLDTLITLKPFSNDRSKKITFYFDKDNQMAKIETGSFSKELSFSYEDDFSLEHLSFDIDFLMVYLKSLPDTVVDINLKTNGSLAPFLISTQEVPGVFLIMPMQGKAPQV